MWSGLAPLNAIPEGVVDVARGKPTSQSSLSQWSKPNESAEAVRGIAHLDYAFHTDVEDRAWWTVDLGVEMPIEAIVVHNRVAMLQERASRLRVEIAKAPGQWVLVHAGFARFGGGGNGVPLCLPVGGGLSGRYVRLSLDERQALHLSQVQVFAKSETAALAEFCAAHGLPLGAFDPQAHYKLVKHPRCALDEIVGIKIDYSGRHGNLMIQYINVIQFVERTGLKYIQLGWHELFDVKEAFQKDAIHFLPSQEALPPVGLFLAGEFFNSDRFVPVLSPFLRYGREEEADTNRVCQRYIIPHILTGLPAPGEQKLANELTIHLRSGDVFNSDHPVTYGYRQPPLAFYILIIERMRKAGQIARVRLVFEDRGNPCVGALEAWLSEQGIPSRTQCVSLRDDMSALVDAEHLVFGHGTFGYAACRLSRHIKTVHFFAPQLGGSYEFMPNIDEVFCVKDTKGKYIKAFEYGKPFGPDDGWRRTPAMYEQMLKYPKEALSIEKVR